jgi:hypothetical protein
MPPLNLRAVRRREANLETLRKNLGTTDAMLEQYQKQLEGREPTSDQARELDELRVRRERIQASLTEAGA